MGVGYGGLMVTLGGSGIWGANGNTGREWGMGANGNTGWE